MGAKNRQRRAAKARKRARQRTAGDGGSWRQEGNRATEGAPGASGIGRARIRQLFDAAAGRSSGEFAAELAAADPALVDPEAEGAMLRLVGLLWRHGWQPAELVRHARRFNARTGRLVATAVAADHVHRDRATLHPRWVDQIDALELPAVGGAVGWLASYARSERIDRVSLTLDVLTAIALLADTRPLHVTIPPPGAPNGPPTATQSRIDDPILVKVRALLAQAESTPFEAEAEAFTAKAQELMARHSLDAALLWAASTRDERPTTIRIPIDDPYADITSMLLHTVARHSRCRAIYDDAYGLSTVIGFASDVATAELMFTSLLVQSQAAMRAAGARAGPGGRARSRGFRSSFLMAFTQRIGQRLAEINADVERDVQRDDEGSRTLLPVLASRAEAIQDVVDELFGELRTRRVRGVTDAAGWSSGTMAADLAKLNAGDVGRRGASAPTLAAG